MCTIQVPSYPFDYNRSIIRHFFALAQKNHLLFVESLLRHPFAPRTCTLIGSKYKWKHATKTTKQQEQHAHDPNKRMAVGHSLPTFIHEEADGVHETTTTVKNVPRSDHTGPDMEGEAEFELDRKNDDNDTNLSAMRRVGMKERKKERAIVLRSRPWSVMEDKYLMKMYEKFQHLPSVYEVLSYEDMFQDRDRTPEQIERRVKHVLKTAMKEQDKGPIEARSENVEEEEEHDRNQGRWKRMRLRRKNSFDEDENTTTSTTRLLHHGISSLSSSSLKSKWHASDDEDVATDDPHNDAMDTREQKIWMMIEPEAEPTAQQEQQRKPRKRLRQAQDDEVHDDDDAAVAIVSP